MTGGAAAAGGAALVFTPFIPSDSGKNLNVPFPWLYLKEPGADAFTRSKAATLAISRVKGKKCETEIERMLEGQGVLIERQFLVYTSLGRRFVDIGIVDPKPGAKSYIAFAIEAKSGMAEYFASGQYFKDLEIYLIGGDSPRFGRVQFPTIPLWCPK